MSNKRKLILYIAASLDGYIATEDDSLEWLFKTEVNGNKAIQSICRTSLRGEIKQLIFSSEFSYIIERLGGKRWNTILKK